jgi:antitoxin VapB
VKTIIQAKVFKNGGSNAIRIPASFKIDSRIVYLSLDDELGEITITKNSPRPFAKLLALHEKNGVISDAEWDVAREQQEAENRPSVRELSELK